MRKWLIVLLLSLIGYMPTQSNNSQNYIKPYITESINELEDLKITLSGFNYLKENFNIETVNIPNGFPVDIKGFNRISSYFGMRYHPIKKRMLMHDGIDLAGSKGTEVYATADGMIEKVAYVKGYGRLIIVNHGNGIQTIYAHLSKFKCKVGEYVTAGDCIGLLGNSGASTGPHLHYEVRVNNTKINPLLLYTNDFTESNILNIFKLKDNERISNNQNSKFIM
jgi:murein DD-endopeptidase MepM/ murein hydrolase activator NlpD